MREFGCVASRPAARRPRDARWVTSILIALTIIGVAIRLDWLSNNPQAEAFTGETWNVAASLATNGRFADAYFPGQGPTAHVTPISPMIAAGVFAVLGVDTPAARATLTAWSLAVVFAGLWVLFRAFGRLGTPVAARLVAFAVAALLPMTNIFFETVVFRTWEGGLAVLLGALCLDRLLRLDAAPQVTMADAAVTALLAAICLLVSPPMGLAAYLGGLVLMQRRLAPTAWLRTTAIVALITSLVLAPWLVRNIIVMHEPILLRDNFGLEMASAFHDAAVATDDPIRTYWQRHVEIHPYGDHPAAQAAMAAAGGETAYFAKLGAEARAWIKAHPRAAAGLVARHGQDLVFPRASNWDTTPPPDLRARTKAAIHGGIAVLAILAVVAGIVAGGSGYAYAGLFAIVPMLPYLLVEPDLRYRYIVQALWLFLACDLAARLVTLVRRGFAARPDGAGPGNAGAVIPD